MIVTVVTMPLLLFILVALLMAFATRWHPPRLDPESRLFWISAIKIASALDLARVSALWYLTYREWTGTQSFLTLPLVLLLYPEGATLPQGWSLTSSHVWLFSGDLIFGSLSIVLGIAALVRTVAPSHH